MIINYYIKRDEDENINFINEWVSCPNGNGDILIAKYKRSNDHLGIVHCKENTQFKKHFKKSTNVFTIYKDYLERVEHIIEHIITKCLNSNNTEVEGVNIIVHWGGDEPSEYKKMTENLKAEVDTYCKKDKDSCKYEYKFYFYTTVLDDKYQTLKKIMYFNNGWEEILNDKFSIEEVKRFPILNSLFILCQGYLAVYRSWGDYKLNEKVSEALQKMGWTDENGEIKSDVTEFIPNNLGGKYDESNGVSFVIWWNQPFGTSFPEEDLKKECEGNDSLYKKVMDIFNNGDGIEPVVVAEAYLALDEKCKLDI